MSEQIAVRLPDDLSESLTRLVDDGRYPTRAAAVRAAIEGLVEAERRRRTGEAIVEAYTRLPQSDDEVEAATAAAIRSIEDEPW